MFLFGTAYRRNSGIFFQGGDESCFEQFTALFIPYPNFAMDCQT